MYIPIVVAMAAKQNVIAAISSGWMAIIAGVAALAGPSKVARRLREMLVPVLLAKPIVAWSAAIGFILLVLYVLPIEPLQSWWSGAIFIVLFVAGTEALRRRLAREFPEALSEEAAPEDAVPAGSDILG